MTSRVGWVSRRARFAFVRRDVRGVEAPLASATKDGVFLRTDLDFSVWNPDSNISNYKLVEPDDFVIGLRSFQHGIAHSTVTGIVSPAYTVLRAIPPLEPRYYKHYFRSRLLISQLANITQGIRQGQAIDIEAFQDLHVPVPPLAEQRQIANFLDFELDRIDRLTRRRIHQAELLDARLRSWLSELREKLIDKFGQTRLRHLVRSFEQGWSPQCEDRLAADGEWGVVKAGCVNSGTFDPSQHKALPADVTPRMEYQLKRGDLLISRASGSPDLIGSAAVVESLDRNLLLCDKVYRLKVDRSRAEPWFVAFMLRSHSVREHIKNGISGAEGMANNLPTSVVKDCILPNAPFSEQRAIVEDIAAAQVATENARSALRRAHERLSERRQALITAAVTGQLDITSANGRGIED